MISTPWSGGDDSFEPGRDFLVAENGEDLKGKPLLARRTCAHRVGELLAIHRLLNTPRRQTVMPRLDLGLHSF